MKKMINSVKAIGFWFWQNITIVCFPLIYISYIFYIRLILERMPRILFVNLSLYEIFITITILLGFIWRLYVLLKKEEIITPGIPKNSIIIWIKTKVENVIIKTDAIWIDFYHIFSAKSIKFCLLILKLARFLYKNFDYPILMNILLIFEILPKLIVILAFLFDIYYFHLFFYFYAFLPLLILPLIFRGLRGILWQFFEDHYADFQSWLDINIVTLNDVPIELHYQFKESFEPGYPVKDIHDFIDNHYNPIGFISDFLIMLDATSKQYKLNWLFITILVLYIIGWSTILFFGLIF